VQLLLGTQMIAKGLDVPNVRLVGVISADTALSLPDFRASERTFGLVAQVAGRSGRSAAGGQVIVQTFTPGNAAIELAAKHDYVGFASAEIEQRRGAGLPPVTRMARVVVRDEELDAALRDAQTLAEQARAADERLGTGVRIVGPVPAPIERIGDYHRQQVTVIADDAATLQRLITALRNAGAVRSDGHMAVDVDPVSLL
jgi:primosomal protein N' (replication factor Y)